MLFFILFSLFSFLKMAEVVEYHIQGHRDVYTITDIRKDKSSTMQSLAGKNIISIHRDGILVESPLRQPGSVRGSSCTRPRNLILVVLPPCN